MSAAPLPEGGKAWEYVGNTTVFSAKELEDYANLKTAELRRELDVLRRILVPGLHIYEGTHVVQIAIGSKLFTSRYVRDDDKPRALRQVIASACAAMEMERIGMNLPTDAEAFKRMAPDDYKPMPDRPVPMEDEDGISS